ncbi:uncharacterized protein LOC122267413 [Penaeus japonicus]|uniref:uncharacterized protein LOC122267413 n=1 Tax=Penaeus japonicus TaxID=27405 RepID=UPI001C717193|nr:uncharacterized protein LOC122267413 [Penaeus japonicus]
MATQSSRRIYKVLEDEISSQKLPDQHRVNIQLQLNTKMRSNIALTIGLLLAAFVLMATLSPAACSALPSQSCCPYHHWCCVQTTTLHPCALIFPDCIQNPYHQCCPPRG